MCGNSLGGSSVSEKVSQGHLQTFAYNIHLPLSRVSAMTSQSISPSSPIYSEPRTELDSLLVIKYLLNEYGMKLCLLSTWRPLASP